jgi:hypothetical protein
MHDALVSRFVKTRAKRRLQNRKTRGPEESTCGVVQGSQAGRARLLEEEVEVTSAKGDSNTRSGSGNPDSGNHNPGRKEDVSKTWIDINMVFTIPTEFYAPMKDVLELALGAERAMFEKPKNPDVHMKPLFIRGHQTEHRSGTCSWMEAHVSTSCCCPCSRSSATLKVILNVQILALAGLQVILRKPRE